MHGKWARKTGRVSAYKAFVPINYHYFSDCSGCLLCLVIVKEQIKIKAKKHYYCKHILLVLFTSGQVWL